MITIAMTKEEAQKLLIVIISGRHGLYEAAKRKRLEGLHESALITEAAADFSEVMSSRILAEFPK